MKKRFLLLLLVLCLVCTDSVFWPPNKAAAESEYPWAVSHVTYDVTYDAILKLYLKIINGYKTKDYGRHDLFNDFVFWDLFVEDPAPQRTVRYIKNTLGFYIDDINQDGVDELVILMTGGYIYEVFTMDEGRVRELIRAGGRYNCRRLSDNTFFRWGNSGASNNSYERWCMNGTGKVSFKEGYVMEPDGNGESWSHTTKNPRTNKSVNMTRVSATEAEGWIRKQENNVLRKRFVPFAAFEKYPDDPWDLGVLAKDSKTTGSAKIRIRKEPSQKSKVVDTKRVGTYVKVLAKEDGYYKVRIGKKEGYVQEDFLIPVTWQESSDS